MSFNRPSQLLSFLKSLNAKSLLSVFATAMLSIGLAACSSSESPQIPVLSSQIGNTPAPTTPNPTDNPTDNPDEGDIEPEPEQPVDEWAGAIKDQLSSMIASFAVNKDGEIPEYAVGERISFSFSRDLMSPYNSADYSGYFTVLYEEQGTNSIKALTVNGSDTEFVAQIPGSDESAIYLPATGARYAYIVEPPRGAIKFRVIYSNLPIDMSNEMLTKISRPSPSGLTGLNGATVNLVLSHTATDQYFDYADKTITVR